MSHNGMVSVKKSYTNFEIIIVTLAILLNFEITAKTCTIIKPSVRPQHQSRCQGMSFFINWNTIMQSEMKLYFGIQWAPHHSRDMAITNQSQPALRLKKKCSYTSVPLWTFMACY